MPSPPLFVPWVPICPDPPDPMDPPMPFDPPGARAEAPPPPVHASLPGRSPLPPGKLKELAPSCAVHTRRSLSIPPPPAPDMENIPIRGVVPIVDGSGRRSGGIPPVPPVAPKVPGPPADGVPPPLPSPPPPPPSAPNCSTKNSAPPPPPP